VPYKESRWFEFYRNVANHLLHGEELAIKPEQARRVIAIMEYSERSAKQGGKALSIPYESVLKLTMPLAPANVRAGV
jgi:hypothetical protein